MKNNGYSLKYPRRIFIRKSMTAIGRLLMSLLTDVEIIGKEKLPKKGPIILAGNHVAVLEAVMMAVYTPGIVEFLANGDIPFDPNYAFIVKAYDPIGVNRGNLDREGLQMGLDVLKQGGILGVFPEGGIWKPTEMQAQIGIALLSHRSGAPILPVGFSGVRHGLTKALHFEHPKLTMNVGDLLPPVQINNDDLSLKTNLEASANQIMTAINTLVPETEFEDRHRRMNETYTLEIEVLTTQESIPVPSDLEVMHGAMYARFLYNPTMMDVLVRNLNLPLKPIKQVYHQMDLAPLISAWQSILAYLKINPGYFTYRFGVEDGLAVKQALVELIDLAMWAQDAGYALSIDPIRLYQNAKTGAEVIEHGGCFPASL